MFPYKAPLNSPSYRIPTSGGWFASISCPPELFQGEYDYNPFAFDVGCLGLELCDLFQVGFSTSYTSHLAHPLQHLTPTVPMLAPLLDGMTTWDIDARLTAQQAMERYETLYSQVDERVLKGRPQEPDNSRAQPLYGEFDRWLQLPPEFIREWSRFRTPEFSVCRYTLGAALVRFVRRLVDRVVASTSNRFGVWGQTCITSRLNISG